MTRFTLFPFSFDISLFPLSICFYATMAGAEASQKINKKTKQARAPHSGCLFFNQHVVTIKILPFV